MGTLLCLKAEKTKKTEDAEDLDISCLWFNPNIHPYTEYKARLNALENFVQDNRLITLIINDYYGLRGFTKGVINNLENKCEFCYDVRIKKCAEFAAGNHFDAFSSTLLVSPYQNHGKIKETGEKYSDLYNTAFFYADFRENFRAGQKQARENNIYMQKYCGCIFSEEERYTKK
jgi:predicted adenine nucleotide alpha hydrolase (AANH) superfamily ATPase